MNVGFFDADKKLEEHYVTIKNEEVTELPQFVGLKVPEAILSNSTDWGFGVFIIDDKSQKFFENNMQVIESQLNKSVVLT